MSRVRRVRQRVGRCVAKVEESSDSDEDDVIVKVYKDSIYYRGEIRQPEATTFCIQLRKLADSLHDVDGVVKMFLTTDGGDMFAGLTMYESIRRCKVPVHVCCDACVCSAGTIVMLGATKRVMYSTSVMLVHALSSWMMGMQKPKQIKQELENCETLLEIMTEIYRKHTRLSKAELRSLYDTDLYMRAEKCKSVGFIDEILN